MNSVPRSAPSLVSVIVPVYNAAPTLLDQLESLAAQTYAGNWEVVVVDNASTDGTLELARRFATAHREHFRVITAPDRHDTGYVRDVGVEEASGDLLLFCDGDDVADRGWVAAMVAAAPDGDLLKGRIEDAGLNRADVRASDPARHSTPGANGPFDFLPFAIGANLGVWRDCVDAVGGWEVELPLRSGHDVVLCWKAQLAGYRMLDVPNAIVSYRLRPDLRSAAKQAYTRAHDQPAFYRLFRAAGMPRSKLRYFFMSWAALVYRLPSLARRDPMGNLAVLRVVGTYGRLIGSIRWRVLFL